MTLRIPLVRLNGKYFCGLITAAAVAATAITAVPLAHSAEAHPFSALAGSWTGGGTIEKSNGGAERIRCRSTYEPAGGAKPRVSMNDCSESTSFVVCA